MPEQLRAARISIISNIMLVITKAVIGLSIYSVSVMSEAIHSGMDLLAALVAFMSIRAATKPADANHPFGHGKIENISGVFQALLIFGAAGWIIYESVAKLHSGEAVHAVGPGLLVMIMSAVVNIFVSRYLYKIAKKTDSIALEADALHLRTDVYTSLGVATGLLLLSLTGLQWLDAVIAIAVSLLILHAAWKLTLHALMPLVDAKLPEGEEQAIRTIIAKHSCDYVSYHRLRTRKAGSERHVDLHLVLPSALPVGEVHSLCHRIDDSIKTAFPKTHLMIHVEPCTDQCDECSHCSG